MGLNDLKSKLLEKEKFRNKYYGKKDLAYEIAQMIIEGRVKRGLTQEELAKRIGTKQTSISRVENGTKLPSLTFLTKIAKALDTNLIPPQFGILNEGKIDCHFESKYTDSKSDVYQEKTIPNVRGWELNSLPS